MKNYIPFFTLYLSAYGCLPSENRSNLQKISDSPANTRDYPESKGLSYPSQGIEYFLGSLPDGSKKLRVLVTDLENNSLITDRQMLSPHPQSTLNIPLDSGSYQIRMIFLDDDDEVIYDSDVCRKKKGSNNVQVSSGKVSRISLSDCEFTREEMKQERGLSDKDRLLNPEYAAPGWPSRPRKGLDLSKDKIKTANLEVSLGFKIWGIGTQTTAKTGLTVTYSMGLSLIRHAKDKDSRLVNEDGSLAWEPDAEFVAICNYTATLNDSAGSSENVSFSPFGAGVSTTGGFSYQGSMSVNTSSKFFNVREGETAEDIKETCQNIFVSEYEKSLTGDFENLLKDRYFMDKRENFETVMAKASGENKDLNPVYANEHTWIIHPVNLQSLPEGLKLSGKFQRVRNYLGIFHRYDQFCFSQTVGSEGTPGELFTDNCEGGEISPDSWVLKAGELATSINLELLKRIK